MSQEIGKSYRLMRSYLSDQLNGLGVVSRVGSSETCGVKTYLLESILPEQARHETCRDSLAGLFKRHRLRPSQRIEISHSTKDPLLTIKTKVAKKEVLAFIDFQNPRFLKLHSASDSRLLDKLVSHWTGSMREFDHAWFNDDFLNWCGSQGKLKGVGVEFMYGFARGDDNDQIEEAIKLRQRGTGSQMLLSMLRDSQAFDHQATLSQVRVRNDEPLSSDHSTDDIRFDGRVSARGNSFDTHADLIDRVFTRYQSVVRDLESRHSLFSERKRDSRLLFRGHVFRIDLDRSIPDLQRFVADVFDGTMPFRLVGVPRRMGDAFYRVAAVDVHTAQHLLFEVFSDAIRVYLPKGTCGNTLLRFHTNIQHRYSRKARIFVPQG